MDVFNTIHSYSPEASDIIRTAKKAQGGLVYEEKCALPYELFFDMMPVSHVEFFKGLVRSHRTGDCLCAHAGVDPSVSNEAQDPRTLIWGTSRFPAKYVGEEITVYGHFNNAVIDAEGWPRPRFEGQTIGIDTIHHGVLTAVRLPDRRVFQSRRYAD
jgi:serine/threonine protein phosphatase 1